MKKIFLFVAVAMVAIASCNKEEVAPIKQNETVASEVTIKADAPSDDLTKTMVDGATVKWATGDHIAVFDDTNAAHDFTLSDGAGSTEGAFTGTIGTSSGWAVYPYSANAAFDGNDTFTLDYASTYAYNAVKVPLVGMEDGGNAGKYDFDNVGGAIKIQYTNVPAGAAKFVFMSTSNITGTGTYDFSSFTFTSNQGKVVTVTDLPSSSTLTFVIPVPAGSYSFNIQLLDSGDDVITGSAKTVSAAKTVVAGHMVPMKAVKLAKRGDVLWGEDFSSYSKDAVPGTGDGEGWDEATINYSVTNGGGTTKVYTENSAGDASPELLVAKTNGTFVASGIPTAGWKTFNLEYYTNQSSALSVEVSVASSTIGDPVEIGTKHYSRSISIPSEAATINITFKMTTSSNARLDGIELKAGAPLPGISVTTVAASGVASADGTTATLNGSLALLFGAVNANVTEAGFYYKLSAAAAYNKVTCASAPTSTTSFSYDLTSLTKDSEYTYYAYAIYDSGSEVYGKSSEKTFTPTKSGSVSVTVNTYSNAATVTGTGTKDERATWVNGDITVSAVRNSTDNTTFRSSDTNHTRFYSGWTITVTSAANTISSIVITCTSDAYATSLANNHNWSNGSDSATSSTVTVSGVSSSSTSVTLSEQIRISSIKVSY